MLAMRWSHLAVAEPGMARRRRLAWPMLAHLDRLAVMKGQKATVLRLLRERGSRGISARELIFDHGITRGAAVVHELKKEAGVEIETIDEGDGKLATYILKSAIAKPEPPACSCRHPKRHHVAGFRCAAILNADEPFAPSVYCPCERYVAAA
jgi:hypothetical protein